MNMKTFANSLTISEVNELSNILFEIKTAWAKQCVKPLHIDEMILVDNGYWIDAIKAYRVRNNNCSLMECKVAIDAYRERK
jgi:hypothetical protein